MANPQQRAGDRIRASINSFKEKPPKSLKIKSDDVQGLVTNWGDGVVPPDPHSEGTRIHVMPDESVPLLLYSAGGNRAMHLDFTNFTPSSDSELNDRLRAILEGDDNQPIPKQITVSAKPKDEDDVMAQLEQMIDDMNEEARGQAGKTQYIIKPVLSAKGSGKRLNLQYELIPVAPQTASNSSRQYTAVEVLPTAKIISAGVNPSTATGNMGQKGHRMDVWIEIDAGDNPVMPQNARPNSVYGLNMEYWESATVNRDVTGDKHGPEGTKPWNDIYGQKPNASTFDTPAQGCDLTWKQAVELAQKSQLRGKHKIGFADYPGLFERPGRDVRRNLEFRIVFRDGLQTREIHATQVLEENNGKMGYTAYKDNLGNSIETYGDVTNKNDPRISGHQGRLTAVSDNSVNAIIKTIPLSAKALIPVFVEQLIKDPVKAADFVEKEKETFLSRLDPNQRKDAGKDWDNTFSDMAKGDLHVAAGQFLIADIPNTLRKEFPVPSGGRLVAIVKGTDILRMYYTDDTTKDIDLMPKNPISKLNGLPLRSFTEIPYDTVKEKTNIVEAMATGKFKTATMISKNSIYLRPYEVLAEQYIINAEKEIGYKIKKGAKFEVDAPPVYDVSGDWIKAKYGDTRGFIEAKKIKISDDKGAQPVTYLYHVYMTPAVKELAQIEQGAKIAGKEEIKRIQIKAEREKEKVGLNDYNKIKEHLGADPMLRFNDEQLRIDVAYTNQQLVELGNEYFSLILFKGAFSGSAASLTEAGGHLSGIDVMSGDVDERARKLIRNKGIYENAIATMQAYDFTGYDAIFTDQKITDIAKMLDVSTQEQAIEHLLGEYEGLLVTESHDSTTSKEFLINNMDTLKAEGMDTIYIEHFRYSEHQTYINEFLASGPTDPMPPMLENLVKVHGLKALVEKAKEKGVRIVALDDQAGLTDKLKSNGNSLERAEYGEERTTKMNYNAMRRIQEHAGKKYVVLIGTNHAHTHAGATTGKVQKGVAGLSQLLHLPAVKATGFRKSNMSEQEVISLTLTGSNINISGLELVREDKTKRNTLAS